MLASDTLWSILRVVFVLSVVTAIPVAYKIWRSNKESGRLPGQEDDQ